MQGWPLFDKFGWTLKQHQTDLGTYLPCCQKELAQNSPGSRLARRDEGGCGLRHAHSKIQLPAAKRSKKVCFRASKPAVGKLDRNTKAQMHVATETQTAKRCLKLLEDILKRRSYGMPVQHFCLTVLSDTLL